MAMTGGIGQQLDQMVSANRGNPSALMERTPPSAAGGSPISPDLLKLLALQALKTEAETKERELALTMQQQPGTVAEQRFAEAESRALGAVTEQVTGVKANQQQQQLSQQQKLAGGPPGARPPGPPPQMAGVAGQPAPNMARMAGGGIVSFANGGQVEALLKELGISEAVYNSRPELKAKIDAMLKDRGEGSQFGRDVGDPAMLRRALSAEAEKARRNRPLLGAETASYLFGTQEGLRDLETRNAAAREEEGLFRGAAQRSGAALSSLSPPPNAAPSVAPDISRMMGDLSAEGRMAMNAGPGGDVAYAQLPSPQPPAQPPVQLRPQPAGIAATPAATSYEAANTRGRNEAADFLGRAGAKEAYERMLTDRRELNKRQAADTRSPWARYAGALSLGDAGVNAERLRTFDRNEERRALDAEATMEMRGLNADKATATNALTAGSSFATGISGEERAKVTAGLERQRNALLSRQIDSTDTNARRKFEGDLLDLEAKQRIADAKNIEAAILNAQVTNTLPPKDPEKSQAIKNMREAAARANRLRDEEMQARAKRIIAGAPYPVKTVSP